MLWRLKWNQAAHCSSSTVGPYRAINYRTSSLKWVAHVIKQSWKPQHNPAKLLVDHWFTLNYALFHPQGIMLVHPDESLRSKVQQNVSVEAFGILTNTILFPTNRVLILHPVKLTNCTMLSVVMTWFLDAAGGLHVQIDINFKMCNHSELLVPQTFVCTVPCNLVVTDGELSRI